MNVLQTYFFTKTQLLNVFRGWGVTEVPPTKGKKVIISFSKTHPLSMAIVTREPKGMFKIEMGNNEAIK